MSICIDLVPDKERDVGASRTQNIAIFVTMASKSPRNGFDEALKLSRLPDEQDGPKDGTKRFISRTPAWRPGADLPWKKVNNKAFEKGNMVDFPPAAFGGHVYAQAPLAAARVVEEEEEAGGNGNGKLGIHVSL